MAFLPLHRASFELGSGVVLDIEAALGRGRSVAIDWHAPRLAAAEEEIDVDAVASGTAPPMCWRDSLYLFEQYQLREDTDYLIDITIPIALAEAQEQAKKNVCWPFDLRVASVFRRDPARRWKNASDTGRPSTTITGQLNLRSHAGVIDLATEAGGPFRAEVVCRKLKYFDEFKALLDDLADRTAELLLSFDSPVSLSFDASGDLAENAAALHFLMRHVMAAPNLPSAVSDIIAQPHVALVERLEYTPIEEVQDPDAEVIGDGIDTSDLILGGPLARLFRGYTPRVLLEREIFESHDTPENRYAKAFLAHCGFISRQLQSRMSVRRFRASEREAVSWARAIDEALQHDLWREVGPLSHIPSNSQTLIRKRGYKELFRLDLLLRLSLALDWKQGSESLVGDIRPVNQIYEYWCFFVLRQALLGLCIEVGGGDFITLSKDGLRVQLMKGRRSECRFEFSSPTGKKVSVRLYYNKRFPRPKTAHTEWNGSYTASFDPDFSVVVAPISNMAAAHWLHFDAKYRLERREAVGLFESENDGDDGDVQISGDYEAELSRVHKLEDLFKMHTYRDGILGTRGAYVLFPGDGIGGQVHGPHRNLFVRHPSALGGGTAHRIPSVGAFDLVPGDMLEGQVAAIRNLLTVVFEMASGSLSYKEEQANF